MKNKIEHGNASIDSKDYRQWLIGKFITDKKSLRCTEDLEIKWADCRAGETRKAWASSKVIHSICILISGKFEMIFSEKNYILSEPGDYVIWGPGVSHNWKSITDSIIITVRWPSEPEDSVDIIKP